MKTIQELESEIWRKIELATKDRNSERLAYFNAVAARIDKVKEAVQSIEHDLFSAKEIEKLPSFTEGNDRFNVHQLPANGTECRFIYKGKEYEGIIKNSKLEVPSYGNFKSFSGASVKITKTSRNGWNDWEIKTPGSSKWIYASTWRRMGK